MSKSHEAFWWSLFSAGGVVAALCVPALIVATGFVLPSSDPDVAAARAAQLHGVVSIWPVRLGLLLVIFLSFFHCAHRVRHTLMDVGLRRVERPLMVVCYGGALAGTVVAAIFLGTL